MRLSIIKIAAVAAGIIALGSTAQAATTVYTTQASYLAALSGATFTNAFTGTSGSAASYSYSGSGFGYTVTVSGGSVYNSGTFVGGNLPTDVVTLASTGTSFNSIGGNFFLTNITDAFQVQPVTITLSNGFTETYTPTTQTQFRGYVSDTAITSLVMALPTGTTNYNALDNVIVGNAIAVTVPEAGSVALIATGILPLVGIVIRRRNKKS